MLNNKRTLSLNEKQKAVGYAHGHVGQTINECFVKTELGRVETH
jgi:hypothetical protein